MILAALIEKVSNISFENYMLNEFLKPLNMNNTCFEYTSNSNIATGIQPLFSIESMLLPIAIKGVCDKIKIKNSKLWFEKYYHMSSPASGFISSASDLSVLINEILYQHKYIDSKTVDVMTKENLVDVIGIDKNIKGIKYGMGWKIIKTEDENYFYHNGRAPGFSCELRIYPENDMGIIILTNNMYFNCTFILDELYKIFK